MTRIYAKRDVTIFSCFIKSLPSLPPERNYFSLDFRKGNMK